MGNNNSSKSQVPQQASCDSLPAAKYKNRDLNIIITSTSHNCDVETSFIENCGHQEVIPKSAPVVAIPVSNYHHGQSEFVSGSLPTKFSNPAWGLKQESKLSSKSLSDLTNSQLRELENECADNNNKEELLQGLVAPSSVQNFKTLWHEQQHILETNATKKQIPFVNISTDKDVSTGSLYVSNQVTTSQSKKDGVTSRKKRKRRQKNTNRKKQYNRPEKQTDLIKSATTPPHTTHQSKKAKAKKRTGNRKKQKQSSLFRGNVQKNGSGSSQSSSSSDECTGASEQEPTHTFTKRLNPAVDITCAQCTTNPGTRKIIGIQSQQVEKSSESESKTAKIKQETASLLPFVEQTPYSQPIFETSVTTPQDKSISTVDDSPSADPETTLTLPGESTNLTVTANNKVPAISSEASASENASSSSSTSSNCGMEIPQKDTQWSVPKRESNGGVYNTDENPGHAHLLIPRLPCDNVLNTIRPFNGQYHGPGPGAKPPTSSSGLRPLSVLRVKRLKTDCTGFIRVGSCGGIVLIHVWVRESATAQQMWSLCVGLIQCKMKQPREFGLNHEGFSKIWMDNEGIAHIPDGVILSGVLDTDMVTMLARVIANFLQLPRVKSVGFSTVAMQLGAFVGLWRHGYSVATSSFKVSDVVLMQLGAI